jgi:hypothetical protein
LADRALVVFQQLSGPEDPDHNRLQVLRDRPVVATEMAFTITDPRRPDDPLVWVNPSFTRLTGWSHDDAVGRNCRLLQGPNTDRAVVGRIARSLNHRQPVTEVLLNYRRDGTAFWNEVSISPWRPWPPPSTPAWSRQTRPGSGCCATRTPATRRPCCSARTAGCSGSTRTTPR